MILLEILAYLGLTRLSPICHPGSQLVVPVKQLKFGLVMDTINIFLSFFYHYYYPDFYDANHLTTMCIQSPLEVWVGQTCAAKNLSNFQQLDYLSILYNECKFCFQTF